MARLYRIVFGLYCIVLHLHIVFYCIVFGIYQQALRKSIGTKKKEEEENGYSHRNCGIKLHYTSLRIGATALTLFRVHISICVNYAIIWLIDAFIENGKPSLFTHMRIRYIGVYFQCDTHFLEYLLSHISR